MTRQYIGARYVPKFFDGPNGSQWVSGVVYEPLTIVQDLGNAYCSKKTVPVTVGRPNENVEYWANIGLFGDLQNQIAELRESLDDVSGTVEAAYGDIHKLEKDVPFTLENVILVGDSFLQGYTPSGNVTSYGIILRDLAQSENPNASFRFWAEGGAGFNTAGQAGHTFSTLISDRAEELTADEKKAITTVIIIGGGNDKIAKTAIDITGTVTLCKNLFPNARIVVGDSPTVACYNPLYNEELINPYPDGRVFVLEDSGFILYAISAFNCGDNIHPTQKGQQLIAYYLWYKSKGLNLPLKNYDHVTYPSGVTVGWTSYGRFLKLTVNGTFTTDANSEVPLTGDLPVFMRPSVINQIAIPVYIGNGSCGLLYYANDRFRIIALGVGANKQSFVNQIIVVDADALS